MVPGVAPVAAQPGCARVRRLFIAIVVFCLAAPLWANHVAHTGPSANHITDQITIDGKKTDVVAPEGSPIGPDLHAKFFWAPTPTAATSWCGCSTAGGLALDRRARGGVITVSSRSWSACCAVFYRGWIDSLIVPLIDVIWAFPVVLLGVALGTALPWGD